MAHSPVRRAVAFLFLPRSCECGNIPCYWGLTGIDHLMIPAIHCGPTNSLRQKEIKEKMDQCFSEERVAAPRRRFEFLGVMGHCFLLETFMVYK